MLYFPYILQSWINLFLLYLLLCGCIYLRLFLRLHDQVLLEHILYLLHLRIIGLRGCVLGHGLLFFWFLFLLWLDLVCRLYWIVLRIFLFYLGKLVYILIGFLNQMVEQGKTIIIITHDFEFIKQCDGAIYEFTK